MVKDTCIRDNCVIKGTYICARRAYITGAYSKDAEIRGICISNTSVIYTYIKSTSTKGTCIGATYIKSVCIGDASICANDTYIKVEGANMGDNFIGDNYVEYADSIVVVKYLGIYLQLFQILELK